MIEIKTEQTVVVAICDGCKKSLVCPNLPPAQRQLRSPPILLRIRITTR
jgi:hypothetical protein